MEDDQRTQFTQSIVTPSLPSPLSTQPIVSSSSPCSFPYQYISPVHLIWISSAGLSLFTLNQDLA